MSDSKYKNNMMLFKSFWGEKETFRMMPITEDCPYAEVIYNPAVATLVVISKIKKQNFQFLPKLDGNGDILTLNKPRANGKPYQEERVTIELLQEYYLTEKEDQIEFINKFAENGEAFDFKQYLRDLENEKDNGIMPLEQKPLLDAHGQPVKLGKK